MLQSQCHHHHRHFFPNLPISLPLTHHKPSLSLPSSPSPLFLYKPHSVSVSALPPTSSEWAWLTHLAELTTTSMMDEEGPIELPSIFSTIDDPSPIQVASSVLLSGAISVFLFRSLRRRAKRAKDSQFRSSGVVKKSFQEEALDSLKALGSASIDDKGPPSPFQAFLGGISAGIIALIFYKFATTIEASLNKQTISDNFSVRQITITIRTIVNGLTYLATFIFGLNSVGLFLYSGQLAIKSIAAGGSTEKETESKSTDQSSLSNLPSEGPASSAELSSRKEEQSSNDVQ